MCPSLPLSLTACVTFSFSLISCSSLPSFSQGNESGGNFWSFAKTQDEEKKSIQLVNVDPSRFLPEGTSINQRAERPRRFLANNNRRQASSNPTASSPTSTAPTEATAPAENDFPPLAPPLLPAFEDREELSPGEDYASLLPPLDDE